jgi:hypothetical protein
MCSARKYTLLKIFLVGEIGEVEDTQEMRLFVNQTIKPMKTDYLDVLLVGMAGLAALAAYFQLTGERKSRSVPVKARRKENPILVRRPRKWRW